MKSFKRNRKGISPVLAVLMMIAVAIAGSLITYAWVTGYIGFTTEKAGQAVMIQSMNYDAGVLNVYVQNVGEGTLELMEDSCLYVDGALMDCGIEGSTDGTLVLGETETAKLSVTVGIAPGDKVTAKVTTALGAFTEMSDYPANN